MSGRHVAVALALTLAAEPALGEEARERGSSGSARSASAGERHHSSGSRDASSSSTRSHESSSSSQPPADAQRRHPRAGTGHGGRYGFHYGYPYYRPSYGYGYYPYFDFYYGSYGGYYPYYGGYNRGYGYRYREAGSVRLLVEPEETRVYVDGYYTGTVDDFDGLFQRLHIAPGRHEIALKLDGYRSHRMKVYVPYGDTLKIHYDMAKGSGEDVEDLVGDVAERADSYDADAYERPRASARDESRREAPESPRGDTDGVGTLILDVQPADASVYVDGEFRGPARRVRSLQLPSGAHRVEIVRPGFRTYEREVELRAGESETLEVELTR